MSQNYQQDPYQQDNPGIFGGQQDPYSQSGQESGQQSDAGWYGAQTPSTQDVQGQSQQDQGQYGGQVPPGQASPEAQATQQGQQGPLDSARQAAENQINRVIDQFSSRIPGGSQSAQKAKEAIGGVLERLQHEGENIMGNVGGIFGGRRDDS